MNGNFRGEPTHDLDKEDVQYAYKTNAHMKYGTGANLVRYVNAAKEKPSVKPAVKPAVKLAVKHKEQSAKEEPKKETFDEEPKQDSRWCEVKTILFIVLIIVLLSLVYFTQLEFTGAPSTGTSTGSL